MEIRKGGAWRTVTSAEAYVGGSWRTLKYAEAYIGGQWRTIVTFAQPLSLSLTLGGNGADESSNITTSYILATPTGGVSPFTYSWTRLSMSGATDFYANSPSSAGTTFTATGVAEGVTATASFRCTVTDTLGTTAHADTTASAQHSTGSVGGGA